MVKTPRTRHSRTTKDPVTIDLTPGEVSRVKAEAEQQAEVEKTAKVPPAEPAIADSVKQDMAEEAASSNERPAAPASEMSGDGQETAAEAEAAASASSGNSQTTHGFGRAGRDSEPPAATPAPPARGGMLSGAVAGGLAALAVVGGLSFSGLLPGAQSARDDAAPVINALDAEVASLREQLSALEAAGSQGGTTGDALAEAEQRISQLSSEVETLRADFAQLGESGGGDATQVDLSPLEGRIAALETGVADLGERATPDAAFEEQVVALREEVVAVREAQTQAATRLDALEQSLGELTGRVDEAAETPATAVIIAASALKAAIDRGAAFSTELDTFASLAPDAPEVAELRRLAADGVPTRAEIAAESDAAANAMIAAARPVDPDAGVIDRLLGSAMGLVQVRPVGMVEGEGVPEIVARLDGAVKDGDYERALAEYESLPETAKAAGEPFIAKLRARHSADQLIDSALAAALKS